jgi:hypothetical protein
MSTIQDRIWLLIRPGSRSALVIFENASFRTRIPRRRSFEPLCLFRTEFHTLYFLNKYCNVGQLFVSEEPHWRIHAIEVLHHWCVGMCGGPVLEVICARPSRFSIIAPDDKICDVWSKALVVVIYPSDCQLPTVHGDPSPDGVIQTRNRSSNANEEIQIRVRNSVHTLKIKDDALIFPFCTHPILA